MLSSHGKLPKNWVYSLPSIHIWKEYYRLTSTQSENTKETGNCNSTRVLFAGEFPSVFKGQINAIEGELFTISLMEDTQPFRVKAPRSVSFAYCEKLCQKLDSLHQQVS